MPYARANAAWWLRTRSRDQVRSSLKTTAATVPPRAPAGMGRRPRPGDPGRPLAEQCRPRREQQQDQRGEGGQGPPLPTGGEQAPRRRQIPHRHGDPRLVERGEEDPALAERGEDQPVDQPRADRAEPRPQCQPDERDTHLGQQHKHCQLQQHRRYDQQNVALTDADDEQAEQRGEADHRRDTDERGGQQSRREPPLFQAEQREVFGSDPLVAAAHEDRPEHPAEQPDRVPGGKEFRRLVKSEVHGARGEEHTQDGAGGCGLAFESVPQGRELHLGHGHFDSHDSSFDPLVLPTDEPDERVFQGVRCRGPGRAARPPRRGRRR